MKQDIITKLENLLQHEDINTASAQIKTIQREYEEAFSKEMETVKTVATAILLPRNLDSIVSSENKGLLLRDATVNIWYEEM